MSLAKWLGFDDRRDAPWWPLQRKYIYEYGCHPLLELLDNATVGVVVLPQVPTGGDSGKHIGILPRAEAMARHHPRVRCAFRAVEGSEAHGNPRFGEHTPRHGNLGGIEVRTRYRNEDRGGHHSMVQARRPAIGANRHLVTRMPPSIGRSQLLMSTMRQCEGWHLSSRVRFRAPLQYQLSDRTSISRPLAATIERNLSISLIPPLPR